MAEGYILGIDIGTTTVKACLVDIHSQAVIESQTRATKANVASDVGCQGSEQCCSKIITAVQFCLSAIKKHYLSRVKAISVSGQMHGIVLWKSGGQSWKQNDFGRYELLTSNVSNLVTWQDQRCTPEFLMTLPKLRSSHLSVNTGYGTATLYWMTQHNSINDYDRCGTIQDLLVTMLCDLNVVKMSTQNAASWGYFDTIRNTWDEALLNDQNFPRHLLPTPVKSGAIAGRLVSAWYEIPKGTPVYAALGDFQCSVVSALRYNDNFGVLNIGTSSQMSFPTNEKPRSDKLNSALEYFPYFEGRYLLVAASLNGGNVVATFVNMLQQWTHELGTSVPESKIWERLLQNRNDMHSLRKQNGTKNGQDHNDIEIVPLLFGERHCPEERAAVTNIGTSSLALDTVFKSLCKGIVSNLFDMMPLATIRDHKIKKFIGSGKVLTANPVLRRELEAQFGPGITVEYGTACDAAAGVALAALMFGDKP